MENKHLQFSEQMDQMRDAIKGIGNQTNPFFDYLKSVPFSITRSELYTPNELFDAYDPEDEGSFERCFDTIVYKHETETGKLTDLPYEIAARNFHDLGVKLAMEKFLAQYEQRQVVGIMGGHSLARTSTSYRLAAEVSKRLTELGFLMISGGGPGAMEATHLGAWMAGRSEKELEDALSTLAQAPTFRDKGWLNVAFKVVDKYPRIKEEYKSLSIPTWFYGHEPPSVFSTHIAKLFENSVREDTLLQVAYGGLIFFEGSAGTLQEIFQEAVQDHYVCFGYPSPMIFVGKHFWTEEVPVVPFFEHMLSTGRYKNILLSVADNTTEIVKAITDFKE